MILEFFAWPELKPVPSAQWSSGCSADLARDSAATPSQQDFLSRDIHPF
jgi:hypothetical protein